MTVKGDRFVHLKVHTEYSLLGSTIRIDDLADRAHALKMEAVAITDDGVMFGVMKFYETMIRAGIKPIIGCDCYLAPRTIADKTTADHQGLCRLTLLAENMAGYRNLCRLATIAATSGFYHHPCLDKGLLRQYSRGLICLSGGIQGDIARLLQQRQTGEAEAAARFYQQIFGTDNFFLEIQCAGLRGQDEVNQELRKMSRGLSIPLAGTNNCRYLDPGDGQYLEIALCVKAEKSIKEADHPQAESDQLYFKSAEEMRVLLADFPQAAENTAAIAGRCCVEFDSHTFHLPRTAVEEKTGRSADNLLKEKSEQGLLRRLKKRQIQDLTINEESYRTRLTYELAIIQKAGVAGYFLLVSEIVDYAVANDIPVGPGRGSAPGCLICYCLRITAIDPIAHGLLFERFFNLHTRSMPDIDLDICLDGRDQVLQYILDKYNKPDVLDCRAAFIITYGRWRSRPIIRDVGRALGMSHRKTDKVARLIPDHSRNLYEAQAVEPDIKKMADSRPEYGVLIHSAQKLEGLVRHASIHAAGIAIGDKPLCNYLPLYTSVNETVCTQFGFQEVEEIGLVKLDLLGLRNLTMIKETLALIKKQGKTPPDISSLDMADEQSWQLLGRGDTDGVFQLESLGMKELLIKIKPDHFNDIIALIVLYRPGPLAVGLVEMFIARKQGGLEPAYPVPGLKLILQETHGLPIYQEQIMRIVQDLAGFSPEQSDSFRRAVGKRKADEVKVYRQLFINGLTAGNTDEATAQELFEQIECFAPYGFNKAHSTAYALIAYQSAYLRAHFRKEFMKVWRRHRAY